MSRTAHPDDYVLRVNLKDGADVRRFCEVRVKRGRDVYIYQPRKGKGVKVSYHESGQQHVKVGEGAPILPPMQLDPLGALVTEENPWFQSLENFGDLLTYKGAAADDFFEIDLPPLPDTNSITLVEVTLGRSFNSDGWVDDRVEKTILDEKIFPVARSVNNLHIRVCVSRLQHQ